MFPTSVSSLGVMGWVAISNFGCEAAIVFPSHISDWLKNCVTVISKPDVQAQGFWQAAEVFSDMQAICIMDARKL